MLYKFEKTYFWIDREFSIEKTVDELYKRIDRKDVTKQKLLRFVENQRRIKKS